MRNRKDVGEAGFFAGIPATLIGGAAGLVLYFAHEIISGRHLFDASHWSVSGPVKWWVLAGMILGAIGGLSLAKWLWDHAVDELHWEASTTVAVGLVLIVFVAILVFVFANGGVW